MPSRLFARQILPKSPYSGLLSFLWDREPTVLLFRIPATEDPGQQDADDGKHQGVTKHPYELQAHVAYHWPEGPSDAKTSTEKECLADESLQPISKEERSHAGEGYR